MNITEFTSKFHTHPVLFIGTGISMRYLSESYSWKGLLKQVMIDLTGSDEDFLNLDSRLNGNNPKIASEIEKIFNTQLEHDRHGKFEAINDEFFKQKRLGNDYSRFKIYISELLRNVEVKPEMEDELKAFKTIRKNISSVITTNYDEFIEDTFNFKPLVGNDILLSNPYGSLYQIHGSVKNPGSIIITQADYDAFNTKYELIRAQLLSLFIHNPIIFFGYSLEDENIKHLLHTIFSYVNPNSDDAEKIKDNFLVVEWDKGNMNTDVNGFELVIDSKIIKVNKIKTDNFTALYNALSNLILPISAMDIRKVQNIVGEISRGSSGIKVDITEDIDSLGNNDKVLVIGSSSSIRYKFQNAKQLMQDYFDVVEEENTQRIKLLDNYTINSNQYFAVFAFCHICPNLIKEKEFKKIQVDKINELKEKLSSNVKLKNDKSTIQDIFDDNDIKPSYKIDSIARAVLVDGNISVEELGNYLKEYQLPKDTSYNKLLVIYDYLKYAEPPKCKYPVNAVLHA